MIYTQLRFKTNLNLFFLSEINPLSIFFYIRCKYISFRIITETIYYLGKDRLLNRNTAAIFLKIKMYLI